ncbi:hypothetical protein [Nitrospira sp. BLG_2]|uniref:hypothetical protein n=1 Tax=Nitrospira sp. BLG_2 TaxID=3397507 RepID=UPI003B99180A
MAGRVISLQELMALPPPEKKAATAQEIPSSANKPTGRVISMDELMALPPPPRQASPEEAPKPPSPPDSGFISHAFGSNYWPKGHGESSDMDRQAVKAGASENLAELTRLLTNVGFDASVAQYARNMADQQNEKYDEMDPNLQQALTKAVSKYGLAALEAAAAISGAGEVLAGLGTFASGFEGVASLAAKASKAVPAVGKFAKTIKNSGSFGAQVARALPEGAAFGAITADPDEDISTGAAIGAGLTPLGVGAGMILSKLLGHVSEAAAKARMADQATKSTEEMEQVLKDNPGDDTPIMLGQALGNETIHKLEVNEIPERAGHGEKAMKKFKKIKENLAVQAKDLGEKLGIGRYPDGERGANEPLVVDGSITPHDISLQLAEKVKTHADAMKKQKQELFKESDKAAADVDFTVPLTKFRAAAQSKKGNLERIFNKTGVGSPASKSLKMLKSILDKTNIEGRRIAQQNKLNNMNDAVYEGFNFLDAANKELEEKLATKEHFARKFEEADQRLANVGQKHRNNIADFDSESSERIRVAQKNLEEAKKDYQTGSGIYKTAQSRKKIADAEKELADAENDRIDGLAKRDKEGLKNVRAAEKARDAAKAEAEKHSKAYSDTIKKVVPDMDDVRESIDNIINLGDEEFKKLLEMPAEHSIDLKTADLTRHHLGLKHADAVAADKSSEAATYASLLAAIADDIDTAIEKAPTNVKRAHDKAMDFYKEKIVPLFDKDIRKIIKKKADPDKIAETFLPLTKTGKYQITQLESMVNHIPDTSKLLLSHALKNSLEETNTGRLFVAPTRLEKVLSEIGDERMGLLLDKAGLDSPKGDIQAEIKRFKNNMDNGRGAFERMANPPTGQKNTGPGMSVAFMNYIRDLLDHLTASDYKGVAGRLAYTLGKYSQYRTINDSRKTLEDIIKIRRGLKIKTSLYHKLSQAPKHAGKPVGLFSTAILNNEDDD